MCVLCICIMYVCIVFICLYFTATFTMQHHTDLSNVHVWMYMYAIHIHTCVYIVSMYEYARIIGIRMYLHEFSSMCMDHYIAYVYALYASVCMCFLFVNIGQCTWTPPTVYVAWSAYLSMVGIDQPMVYGLDWSEAYGWGLIKMCGLSSGWIKLRYMAWLDQAMVYGHGLEAYGLWSSDFRVVNLWSMADADLGLLGRTRPPQQMQCWISRDAGVRACLQLM